MKSDAIEEKRSWWRDHMSSVLSVGELPLDNNSVVTASDGVRIGFGIDKTMAFLALDHERDLDGMLPFDFEEAHFIATADLVEISSEARSRRKTERSSQAVP